MNVVRMKNYLGERIVVSKCCLCPLEGLAAGVVNPPWADCQCSECGLCHGHYQSMRGYVRKGKATEAKLEARGLLAPKGTGGNKVTNHQIFICTDNIEVAIDGAEEEMHALMQEWA